MDEDICTADGCVKTATRYGLCAEHYRLQRMAGRTCALCDALLFNIRTGLCMMHYQRYQRTGDALSAPKAGPNVPKVACKYDGCDTTAVALGFCIKHWNRNRVHGDPSVVLPPANKLADDELTYMAAHQRIRAKRGPASSYSCVDCGAPAAHWSFRHQDVDDFLVDDRGPFSSNISDYEPRCVRCHSWYDRGIIAPGQLEEDGDGDDDGSGNVSGDGDRSA